MTIEILLNRKNSQKEIAKVLKRNESIISREISNNSVEKKVSNKTEYLAQEAHHKVYIRRYNAKTQSMTRCPLRVK
jgi:IS30 family transposase